MHDAKSPKRPEPPPRKTDGPQPPISIYDILGAEAGQTVTQKNQAYGSSFAKAGEFLTLLYPEGLRPHQYLDMLALVRIFDKMMRIATDKDALGEDPYKDIIGYGILGAANGIEDWGAFMAARGYR